MKTTIRASVFETNSSSTHVIAIMSKKQYEKYMQNEPFILCKHHNGDGRLLQFLSDMTEEDVKDTDRYKIHMEYMINNSHFGPDSGEEKILEDFKKDCFTTRRQVDDEDAFEEIHPDGAKKYIVSFRKWS